MKALISNPQNHFVFVMRFHNDAWQRLDHLSFEISVFQLQKVFL